MPEEMNYIIQNVIAYRAAKIIIVSNYFNIFTLVESGWNTLDKLVTRLKTNLRATELLLNALVALDLLMKDEGTFHNTHLSKACLVKGSPNYMGNNLNFQELIWECWSQLKEVIKTGKPKSLLEDLLSDQYPEFTHEYIQGMNDIAKGPAQAILKAIDLSHVNRMLDIGGGPGTYSICFAKSNPNLRAVILDLPRTLNITRQIVAESNAGSQIELLEGNYALTDFGQEAYDLILLSHITHDEGPEMNRLLLKKAYAALNPGGVVIVHDFLIDQSKTSPKFAALFAVNMLVYTAEGRTYSFNEYRAWMEGAGLKQIECVDILPELDNKTSIIIGRKNNLDKMG